MPLFLDRLPLHTWTDQTKTPPKPYWSVVLPVIVTEANVAAPGIGAVVQDWVLDSANSGEAFAWRYHLLAAGLDPSLNRYPTPITVTSALGSKLLVPIRLSKLWLVSNLPSFQGSPFPMALERGIAFRDVPALPDPYFHRPLLGIRALRKAGLRVEIDFGKDTLSVWTPDPPLPSP